MLLGFSSLSILLGVKLTFLGGKVLGFLSQADDHQTLAAAADDDDDVDDADDDDDDGVDVEGRKLISVVAVK